MVLLRKTEGNCLIVYYIDCYIYKLIIQIRPLCFFFPFVFFTFVMSGPNYAAWVSVIVKGRSSRSAFVIWKTIELAIIPIFYFSATRLNQFEHVFKSYHTHCSFPNCQLVLNFFFILNIPLISLASLCRLSTRIYANTFEILCTISQDERYKYKQQHIQKTSHHNLPKTLTHFNVLTWN